MVYLSLLVVQYYFDKRRTMATGLVTTGASVGVMFFSIFTRTLLNHYGWRWTLRIEALICLIGGAFGFIFKPLKKDELKDVETQNNNEENKLIMEKEKIKEEQQNILKNPMLYVLCFTNFTYILGVYIPYSFTPERAESLGISSDRAAFIICLFAIIIVLERTFFGWIGK